MKFQVLSHAGLLVEDANGTQLVCDPWLIGSCYWRSWFNYPPVQKDLISQLKPSAIYLTHIHWDHFHGPSLKYFDSDIQIVVPKGNYDRSKRDLKSLGFTNVVELQHAEKCEISKDFSITSYQFGIFLDSALMIECEDHRILNLNDSKHMSHTLRDIVSRHKKIDFVLRSHSSANSRMSYQIVDEEARHIDDIEEYARQFADVCISTGAKYAVPFASNHCHLHKDALQFNQYVQTPLQVKEYFESKKVEMPELKVMVSGDSWDSMKGFDLSDEDWFSKEGRSEQLKKYLESNQKRLDLFYKEEAETTIRHSVIEKYFKRLCDSIPYLLRRILKDCEFTYVLQSGDSIHCVASVNIFSGSVRFHETDVDLDFKRFPIQIVTSTFIFRRSIAFKIFSHMAISKRVTYKLRRKDVKKLQLLNLIYNLDEYDMLPIRRIFSYRSISNWILRYREIFLYLRMFIDRVIHKKIDLRKYTQS